jgi:hypothetical protein
VSLIFWEVPHLSFRATFFNDYDLYGKYASQGIHSSRLVSSRTMARSLDAANKSSLVLVSASSPQQQTETILSSSPLAVYKTPRPIVARRQVHWHESLLVFANDPLPFAQRGTRTTGPHWHATTRPHWQSTRFCQDETWEDGRIRLGHGRVAVNEPAGRVRIGRGDRQRLGILR